MYRDIERQGRLLAETLAIPVMNDLLYERLGLVEEGGLIDNYITGIFSKKEINLIYIAVLDENGRIISHNDFNEYGHVYDDPITVRALASDSTVVQKFHDQQTDSSALDFATPLSIGKKRWGTLKFAVSLKVLEQEVHSTILRVSIITIMMLAVSFGIIVLLSRRFIKPITELARTMEQARGDRLDVKVITKNGTDEIARLGQSFNQMIDRIRDSNLEIKRTHKELLQFVGIIEKAGGDTLDVKVDIEGSSEITLLCQSFNRMIDRIRESNIELKKTHKKLLQSQKLASIGILASGVAHEVNNPLGGLFNCVHMLEEKGEDGEFRQRYLDLLKDGLSSIENTVGKLLWMSSKGEKISQDIEVKQALSDAFGLIEYKLKKSNISYNENIEAGLTVRLDPNDLQQVLINLMINALQSMAEGGILTINAFCKGSKVMLEVRDTGEGIEKKDISKIFDPFYTTKPPGEGTGLGLWLTYDIVNSYGGEITVTSRKKEGTTFLVKFNSKCETP
ncbi:MAG: HAMP domain-containing protein [Deltaproteobacteria bacterium]|nr:HAMP domain-containing protein [Deltaproteobacteria bacterium]